MISKDTGIDNKDTNEYNSLRKYNSASFYALFAP
jgi:hypothetical protein